MRTHLTPVQRRGDAAPLGLALAGWVLVLAPVAHPLLAHGGPFLRGPLDDAWVHHGSTPGRSSGPAEAPGHHHAPGSPEHLQLPLLAALPQPAFETAMLSGRAPRTLPGEAVSLARRWSEERPQAP